MLQGCARHFGFWGEQTCHIHDTSSFRPYFSGFFMAGLAKWVDYAYLLLVDLANAIVAGKVAMDKDDVRKAVYESIEKRAMLRDKIGFRFD